MANPLRGRSADTIAPVVPRSNRGWQQDMVDHMNATMNPAARDRGLQWFPSSNGGAYLGYTIDATRRTIHADNARQEAERRDWKRKRLEAEMEHRPFADTPTTN